jgi:RNA polymerase sigma-70 factor (ECF subfamily)
MDHAPPRSSAALEALIEQCGVVIRRVASRYRFAEADLDELVQEVRIRLWRMHAAHREDARPASVQTLASPGYVYRCAVTAAVDMLRRRRARRAHLAVPVESLGDVAEGRAASIEAAGGPAQALDASELARAVEEAIESIPASRRGVVRMYLAGYPREEIAELFGWTEAKTRNLLYRGLGDLRQRLGAKGIGYGSER